MITVPHQDARLVPKIEELENVTITTFVESDYFTVYKWEVSGIAAFSFNDQYLLLSVIKGEGTLLHNGQRYGFEKGAHLIIPEGFGEFEVEGNYELIISHT